MSDKPKLGQPRPIEQQTWRRHHTGRANLAAVRDKPGYFIPPSTTSGCARRRRKAIERRQAWHDGTYGIVTIEIGATR